MKPFSHSKILLLMLGLMLVPAFGIRAQEASPAPAVPARQAEPAPAPEPEMRDLTDEEKTPADEATEADEDASDRQPSDRHQGRRHRSNERISFGSSSTLAAGESAQAVVSILGSSTSAGEVHDAVVSVLGGSRIEGGTVGREVVSILGNTYINGEVRGEVVTVLGNVELGPKAVVHGELVCIGGQITRAEGSVHTGNVQNIAIAGRHFDFTPLTTWFHECLLYGRLLAFHRDLWLFWVAALALLGFYAVVALIAPSGVNKCIETLETRPGSSLLAALLTLLLTPVAYILLAVTIALAIGIVLIPAFTLGLFFASLFGKIVMLAWLGRRFTKLLGDGPLAHPFFGVLLGGAIVLGLYTIPLVGFVVHKLLGILGLGVVVYTLINQFKASRPPKPAPVAPNRPVPPPVAVAGVVPPVEPAAAVSPVVEPPPGVGMPPEPSVVPPVVPLVSSAPPVISAATLPRAGFWIRVAAALLDTILVGIVFGMLEGVLGWFLKFAGSFPLWFTVYHVAMWATKGTTVGGIICGLKVVRVDDRPFEWSVAVVRALGAFLSFTVAGLGFIWVAFDDEKQSWHDKIAGTTIVRVPKGTSLL